MSFENNALEVHSSSAVGLLLSKSFHLCPSGTDYAFIQCGWLRSPCCSGSSR